MTVARLFSVPCLLLAAMTVGCSGGSGNPPTYPVTGIVTYQGAPVADAVVAFDPVDGAGQGATGQTDSEGKYALTTFERHDGALPGNYKVRVFKFDQPAQSQSSGPDDEENYVPPEPNARPAPAPKHLLPEIYFSDTRTPLRFTVEGAGSQEFDISLERG